MELRKNQIELIKKALHEASVVLKYRYPEDELVFIDLAFDVLHGKINEQQAGRLLTART